MLMVSSSSFQDSPGAIFKGLLTCFYTFSLSSLVFIGLHLQVVSIIYDAFEVC